MSDQRAWRLEVKLSGETSVGGPHPSRKQTALMVQELRKAVASDVVVEEDESLLVIRASRNVEIEQARLALDGALLATGAKARVAVAHRDKAAGEWTLTARPYRAPRSTHGGRAPTPPRPLLSRRAKMRWVALFLVAAVAGATYYALAPGVASYQLGFALVLPLLGVVLFWLHRRLPTRLQWTLAIALAAAGPSGYLIYGGSQWWAWGQVAVVPFVLLVLGRSVSRTPPGVRREPRYGGPMQRPWGPP